MATIAAALVTTIDTNWNVGLGGAKPTIRQLMSDRGELADTTEQVIVRVPWFEDSEDINDSYSNIKFTLTVRIKTTTDEDRLKEIKDEVIRVVRTNAVTGIDRQTVGPGENKSDKSRTIFIHELKVICEEHVTAGGSSYSGTTTGDVNVTGDLTVTGEIKGSPTSALGPTTITGDGTVSGDLTIGTTGSKFTEGAYFILDPKGNVFALYDGADDQAFWVHSSSSHEYLEMAMNNAAHRATIGPYNDLGTGCSLGLLTTSTGNVLQTVLLLDASKNGRFFGNLTVDGTLTTATAAQIDDLLMFGSANAAWVPCTFTIETVVGKIKGGDGWSIANVDATDVAVFYNVPTPMVKGTLKLYITGVQVILSDADASDYIDRIRVAGVTYDAATVLADVTTDRTAPGKHTSTFAAVDCSGYDELVLYVEIVATTVNELDIRGVQVQCYYAA